MLKSGRWLTCDPLGFTVGANLYAFVKNNPLTILDEYGLVDMGLWRGARQRSDPSYGYRPQAGDFRKTVGGMTHAVADFGISSVHFVQTGLTYIGAEQLEFGSRMKERMFSSMEREQAYDMRRTDRWMRQQFSVGSVDPVYDSSRNATALGLEIGSLLYGGVGLVKCGYATWRWGMSAYNAGRRGLGAFSAAEGLGLTRVPKTTQYTRSNCQIGQKMHRLYRQGEADCINSFKEYILPSRKRIDFLDLKNGIIYEFKPNNPRCIRLGKKQLDQYAEELKTIPDFQHIKSWKQMLDTY